MKQKGEEMTLSREKITGIAITLRSQLEKNPQTMHNKYLSSKD